MAFVVYTHIIINPIHYCVYSLTNTCHVDIAVPSRPRPSECIRNQSFHIRTCKKHGEAMRAVPPSSEYAGIV